ncbi:hypothetical protein GGR53DRAFT_511489 [Hypoxylon sp. FL1150]|nr:hypothetical protein GGR53DRAFT_511489 [Hypoxylon sp. FL1150]
MSADTNTNNARPSGDVEIDYDHVPATPPDATAVRHVSSQHSIPSTEGPNSPFAPTTSFKTELNDDHDHSSQIIPSSLTPPPSSQVPRTNGVSGKPLNYISSQRAGTFSPPTTALRVLAQDDVPAADFVTPTSSEIANASAETLRTMIQACLAENARLKMETAHHKLQHNLLSMQADEDAKRAAVEHDMTRREVEVLRMTRDSHQARKELNAAAESTQVKYRELQVEYEVIAKENEALQKRIKSATKLIQQQSEERAGLIDERDMLLNRIRENREHFHMLCSPGGAFHGALTPKTPAATTPQQYRATRQTPKSAHRDIRRDNDSGQGSFAVLLQALNHDNSAPSTPIAANRPASRAPSRHTRAVQSLSSLPTTPTSRALGDYSGLLPSVDLVPQTEPPSRYSNTPYALETPAHKRGRQSRESTISADDNSNEQLARAALESVAAATQSYMSQGSRASRRREDDEEIFESQASQAASEMLRRDPRENFEVTSSVGSRDGTPAPAEKTAKLQSKLFAGLNKAGLASEKRKFHGTDAKDSRRETVATPTKKIRYANGGETNGRVGLGIRYGQET